MIKEKRIGLGIVAFDACEHLINILSELKGLVDYVAVGLQKVSYHNKPIDPEDYNECLRLKEIGYINEIIEIETDLNKFAREQETDKRNKLLQSLQDHGCDYSLIIDSDEYYKRNQFERCVTKIIEAGIDLTYCRYVNYFGDYKHYLVYPFKDGCWVPFIAKSKYRFQWNGKDFPKPSDPTRRFLREKSKDNTVYIDTLFEIPWNEINMHHLSWIRADISRKLENWSSKTLFKDYLFLSDKSIEVYNSFKNDNNNHIEKAVLLFNTPEHKVDIAELPKQYIKPKYDISKVLKPVSSIKKICILVDLDYTEDNHKWNLNDIITNYTQYKNDNTDVVFYTSKEYNKKLSEDVIYINTSMNKFYTKLINALKIVKEKKYDFVIKVEPTVWINIDLLRYYLNNNLLNRRNIYGGNVIKSFHTKWNPYVSDEAMILSDICLDKVITTYNQDIEKQFPNTADILIGAILNNEYAKIGLNDINSKWASMGIKYGFSNMDITANKQYDYIFVKILWGDVNEVWNELNINKPDFTEDSLKEIYENRTKNPEKIITIKETRNEWINKKLDSYVKSEIYNNMMLYNNPEHPHIL